MTLAELGVRTNRDGTLMVDTAVLNRVLAANPARVAAVLHTGLGGTHLGITPMRAGATPKWILGTASWIAHARHSATVYRGYVNLSYPNP
jgi:flagellar capping protein FliD